MLVDPVELKLVSRSLVVSNRQGHQVVLKLKGLFGL
jgi:hypothetical protein